MTYRLFIAIQLPEAIRQNIAALPRTIQGARYTKPGQMHLTLRFLGETPGSVVPRLTTRLEMIRQSPFQVGLAGLGVFPSARDPRVLWAGISPGVPVFELRRKIDHALSFPPDRQEFTPHITLARLGINARQDTQDFLATHATFQTGCFLVDRFHLFRSQLQPSGAIHELIASFFLA